MNLQNEIAIIYEKGGMELISYKPLWKTLVEREMKKTDLLDVVGISRGTLTKLSKNEPVSVKIIDRICEKLEIEVTDVVEYVKSE